MALATKLTINRFRRITTRSPTYACSVVWQIRNSKTPKIPLGSTCTIGVTLLTNRLKKIRSFWEQLTVENSTSITLWSRFNKCLRCSLTTPQKIWKNLTRSLFCFSKKILGKGNLANLSYTSPDWKLWNANVSKTTKAWSMSNRSWRLERRRCSATPITSCHFMMARWSYLFTRWSNQAKSMISENKSTQKSTSSWGKSTELTLWSLWTLPSKAVIQLWLRVL